MRKRNMIALKVKILPFTETRGVRIKFTQTDTKKSLTVPAHYCKYSNLEQVHKRLGGLEYDYNTIIDYTQNDYYIFAIDIPNNEPIPDLIEALKTQKIDWRV